jgi:hypothetical protein
MTSSTTNINVTLRERLQSVLRSIGALFMLAAESSATYRRLEYYNALSDEELARRGMTRADVVQRVLGPRFHI